MSSSSSANPPSLLKAVLEPLLADFQYWFACSRSLLELNNVGILSAEQQADLLARVTNAQHEVRAAQILFQATGEQAGVQMTQIAAWQRLVGECWQVASRWRAATGESASEV